MRKFILIASSAALALSLAACKKTEQATNSAESSAGNAAESASNMASNAMVDVKEAMSPTPNGQEFADKAAKSDAFEIATGNIAPVVQKHLDMAKGLEK
jgi:putative membrane protein